MPAIFPESTVFFYYRIQKKNHLLQRLARRQTPKTRTRRQILSFLFKIDINIKRIALCSSNPTALTPIFDVTSQYFAVFIKNTLYIALRHMSVQVAYEELVVRHLG